ncbi:MAG: ribonuclease HII [Atopobiaceae bacterium]
MEKREPAKDIARKIHEAAFEEFDAVMAAYAGDGRKQVQEALARASRRHEREAEDRKRVEGMYALQEELGGDGLVVGVDEVGRGAIAGPLTVGAVILPKEPKIWGLNDSKQLTPEKREVLAAEIADVAIAVGMAHIPPETIDALGMSVCLRRAMAEAIASCGVEPDCVLIDGNPVHVHPKEKTLVKGDARIAAIAAASIVAKVTRDHLMCSLAEEYPMYGWDACKGYGSKEHIEAIRKYGLSPYHRATFCTNFVEDAHLF